MKLFLASQYAAIDAVRIGNSYREPHEVAVKILTEGLVDLGLLNGDINELIETESIPSILYAWYRSLVRNGCT